MKPEEVPEKEPIEVLIERMEEESKPKEQENPNSNSLIVLNSGHALNTKGKESPNGIKEYELNKPITLKAKKYAENLGYKCIIANDYDYEDENPTKALNIAIGHINRIASQAKKEGKKVICISIHCDAHQPNFPKNEWNEAGGTSSFYYRSTDKTKESTEGKKLAIAIHKEMVKSTGFRDRAWSFERAKAIGRNLGVLRKTICPTALVECGFMTNLKEFEFLKSDEGQDICAKAIIRGANNYFWE